MKLSYINHDKTRLLIFFCGFYTDENCFLEFDHEKSDILFVYDYSNLDMTLLNIFDFAPYTEINLIAYSYGVFAANVCAKVLPFINKSTAVAGTIYPVDENYGIKPKVYDLMLNSFNEDVLNNFVQKMELNSNGTIKKADREIENLKNELENIKNYVIKNKIKENLNFDRVIITTKDRIIPYQAQKNFWAEHRNVLEVQSGHFPFFEFNSFDEILEI